MKEWKWKIIKKLLEGSLMFWNLNYIGIHIKMFIIWIRKIITKLMNCLLTKLKGKNIKFLKKYSQLIFKAQ